MHGAVDRDPVSVLPGVVRALRLVRVLAHFPAGEPSMIKYGANEGLSRKWMSAALLADFTINRDPALEAMFRKTGSGTFTATHPFPLSSAAARFPLAKSMLAGNGPLAMWINSVPLSMRQVRTGSTLKTNEAPEDNGTVAGTRVPGACWRGASSTHSANAVAAARAPELAASGNVSRSVSFRERDAHFAHLKYCGIL